MNNSMQRANIIKYTELEKKILPFFNALPHDVPTSWMIPFLNFIEDFQYLQYILNNITYPNIKPWILKLYTLFNPDLSNPIFYIISSLFHILFIAYIYIILFYQIYTNGRRVISKRSLKIFNICYLIMHKYLLSIVFNFFTSCIYLCKKSYLISGIPECSTNENTLFFNTDCLSHGKSYGTIHITNSYNTVIAKLVLALLQNFVPVYLEYVGLHDKSYLYSLIIINIVIFIYLAYNQNL
ncbi:hypothetical protein LY90DRAFT_145721 [Neocallimastix californiae]|uniref:Uncharacterized protein n=1 Tax=Neocallimastix californiae TaxID=1754190 RepID=A0A1Y2AGJ7_9FUNG|nr:hypothetical protein LY90DRAFT_145721 [Neocallimastix californiae]|eukprot:ORY21075.1 hypothetical protein LY90DRAFT_145721 [Neocallimastix californiae]